MDSDRDAIFNYRKNICEDAWHVDLCDGLPNERALRRARVLIAGPPCQGFSTAGRRRLDDERNQLLPLTALLALRLLPDVVVVENVSGVVAGAHAVYWQELEQRFRLGGYWTHSLRCDSSSLGMAQTRKRMLMFAWRTKRDVRFILPREFPGTLRSVLRGVSKADNHRPCLLSGHDGSFAIAARIRPGQKLCNVRGGPHSVHTWDIPEVFGMTTKKERTLLELLRCLRRRDRRRPLGDADPVSIERLQEAFGAPFFRLLKSLQRKGFVRCVEGHYDLTNTFNGLYRRLTWDKPSCTVDTRFGLARYFLHPTKARPFTVREAARIQGFPDQYVFFGDEPTQFRLVGNAVPPPVGRLAADFTKQMLAAA
jgi:DNA (cytosine-5)-methyltransferase 1